MATYEVLTSLHAITLVEDHKFIAYKKKSFMPSHKIKKILKSIRKFFKKPKVSPIEYNGDISTLEILSNEHQQPNVEINFYSEEEFDNQENERLEAEMARQ